MKASSPPLPSILSIFQCTFPGLCVCVCVCVFVRGEYKDVCRATPHPVCALTNQSKEEGEEEYEFERRESARESRARERESAPFDTRFVRRSNDVGIGGTNARVSHAPVSDCAMDIVIRIGFATR